MDEEDKEENEMPEEIEKEKNWIRRKLVQQIMKYKH